MRTRLSPVLVTLFALGGLPWPPQAQAQTSSTIELPQLMQRLAAVKQANAHFIERKTLHILRAPIMDSGTLTYAAPARLEKNTLMPKPERLLVDGDKLTIEHDGQTQALSLTDYPQIGGFIEGIRATLAGDLATLNRIYAVNLTGTSNAWHLLLQPRDRKMQQIVRSIRISGTDAHVQHIDTDEGQGDSTDMTIVEDAP